MDIKNVRRILLSLPLFALASCAPIPAEFQLTFEEADKRGRSRQNAAYEVASIQALTNALAVADSRCINSMFPESGTPLPARRRQNYTAKAFAYVLGIGKNGRIEAVYVNSNSRYTECLQQALTGETLPEPPEVPYFERGDSVSVITPR